MQKPLSYMMYFRNHKKTVLGAAVSIGISILLIGAIQFYTLNMYESYERNFTKYEYASSIRSQKGDLSKDTVNKIKNNGSVDKVIKTGYFQHRVRSVFGTDTSVDGFYADEKDIRYILGKMNFQFKEGTGLKNGDKKILLNENTARFKNVKVGDFAGKDVSKDDYFPGKYKISGILKGDNTTSFIAENPDKLECNSTEYQYLVFPKKGKMSELNKFLKKFKSDEVKVETYDDDMKEEKQELEGFNTVFNLVIILIIIVMSVVLGNSSYINYFNRRREIGILKAIGHTRGSIIIKMIEEIGISSLAGFSLGYLLLYVFAEVNNKFYLYPKGLTFFHITWSLFPKLLSIPLFITIFSVIPVSRLLDKIEPISIIERIE
ncbi:MULTISPECIES: ABC transporter permease [Clostridium]|uniref:ABC transporter permease n=1 Tax=Clostridium TaxID=1485 RepID=UPI00082634D3|nr:MULTISPECIES: ABC transporter permease [Clostridium]PJI09304.1 ABC transporter permease [Clostridium sp. CT7]